MVRIDLARVVGPDGEDEESSRGLLSSWVTSRAKETPGKPRSTRHVWYYFIGALLILQALVLWRFFFRPEITIAAGPPYDQDETVALVTQWYQLLQDMRYLGKEMVAYPPHTGENAINITLAENILGLDEKVIETLLALPYVIPHEDRRDEKTGAYLDDAQVAKAHEHSAEWYQGWMGQDRDMLWRGGHFVDYRNDTNLWLSRDPLGRWRTMRMQTSPASKVAARESIETFAIPLERQMMFFGALPPTAIPLSTIGYPRYGLSLVLDTASNRILVLDSQTSKNGDPFFERFELDKIPSFYNIPKTKFYGKERDARLAPDLLRDFISQTAKLSFVPGSVREDEHFTPELSPPLWETWVRDLYRAFGWPKPEPLEECHWLQLQKPNNTCGHKPYANFKGPQFDRAMKELRHNITVRYMSDWYCPVPRESGFIAELKISHPTKLTEEQLVYAESDEPVIPQNSDPNGWGMRLFLLQD